MVVGAAIGWGVEVLGFRPKAILLPLLEHPFRPRTGESALALLSRPMLTGRWPNGNRDDRHGGK